MEQQRQYESQREDRFERNRFRVIAACELRSGASSVRGEHNREDERDQLAQALSLVLEDVADARLCIAFESSSPGELPRLGVSLEAPMSAAIAGLEAAKLRDRISDRVTRLSGGYRFAEVETDRVTARYRHGTLVLPRSRMLTGRTDRSVGFASAATVAGFLRLADRSRADVPDLLELLASSHDLVRVELRYKTITLSEAEHRLIRRALDALDRSVLAEAAGMRRELENWLVVPKGLRVRCTIESPEPLRLSLVADVSRVVFGCANEAWPHTGSGPVPKLDLSDCLPEPLIPPAVFPSRRKLLALGFTRSYDDPPGLPTAGTRLGRTLRHGHDVYLPASEQDRHCYLVGATGTGKSTLLFNMIMQDIRAGSGLVLLDPHGDLYSEVLAAIPLERAEHVVLIDPTDRSRAPGINFLECPAHGPLGDLHANFVVNEMLRIFHQLYDLDRTGGPMFEQYMRNAMLLAIHQKNRRPTLLDIPLIFRSRKFRTELANGCTNAQALSFWKLQAETARGEASLTSIAPYVTSKLNQFTDNAMLRPIVAQKRSTIDFGSLIDTKALVLANLAKGLIGELDARLLGMLILGKLFAAVLGRARTPRAGRTPVRVYLDEFQNLATETMASMLAESRKYGLGMVLANQTLRQARTADGGNLVEAILGNVGTLISFRVGAPDGERLQSYFAPSLGDRDLVELPDFHAATRLRTRDAISRPFVFRTDAPGPSPLDPTAQRLIGEKKSYYTRPIERIEAETARLYLDCMDSE